MKITFTVNFTSRWLHTQTESNSGGMPQARAARARGQRSFVRNHLLTFGKNVPKLPATVVLTRVATGRIKDDDNLMSAMKHIRDEVAAYLKHQGAFGNWWEEVPSGHGDSEDDPVTWIYTQEKVPRMSGRHAVRVSIEGSDG